MQIDFILRLPYRSLLYLVISTSASTAEHVHATIQGINLLDLGDFSDRGGTSSRGSATGSGGC